MQRPPTTADVARLAGVSAATVSRAFNSPGLLDVATLQRVRDAAARLDYRPHGVARSLRSRRSLVIGVVIPSLRNAYFAESVERLQALLSAQGYMVLIASSHYEPSAELDAIKAMAAQRADAVLLLGRPLHPQSRLTLEQSGVPTLRGWVWGQDSHCIGFDHDAALRGVVRHLLDLGHRRFALVAPFRALHDTARSRLSAVREALAEAGLALPASAVVDDQGFGLAGGRAAWSLLHSRRVDPTAVVCSSDPIAAGVIVQARLQGLQVPQQLSVSGYNGLDLAAAFDPPITSVSTPMAEHAEEVAAALLKLANGKTLQPTAPLPTELVVRGSTGPAPR